MLRALLILTTSLGWFGVETPTLAQEQDAGRIAFERGHYYTALREWRQQANQGDANAMTNLGYLFEQGLAVRQDYNEAMRWYREAAEARQPQALHNLGMLYANGYGVEKNDREALRFFRDAVAESELPESEHMIGVAYHEGLGTTQDRTQALDWFLRAARQGYAPAQYMVGYLFLSGDAGFESPEGAYVWSAVSAQGGMEDAAEIRDLAWLRVNGTERTALDAQADLCIRSNFEACPEPIAGN